MHLPSAGMIRFRFDGFASLHLSPGLPARAPRGKTKDSGLPGRGKGAMSSGVPTVSGHTNLGEITAFGATIQDPLTSGTPGAAGTAGGGRGCGR
jgi:hypothetical protein